MGQLNKGLNGKVAQVDTRWHGMLGKIDTGQHGVVGQVYSGVWRSEQSWKGGHETVGVVGQAEVDFMERWARWI